MSFLHRLGVGWGKTGEGKRDSIFFSELSALYLAGRPHTPLRVATIEMKIHTISFLFQTGIPNFEEFVTKATKLHGTLRWESEESCNAMKEVMINWSFRSTIVVLASFLDTFQKIADAATNTKGTTANQGCQQRWSPKWRLSFISQVLPPLFPWRLHRAFSPFFEAKYLLTNERLFIMTTPFLFFVLDSGKGKNILQTQVTKKKTNSWQHGWYRKNKLTNKLNEFQSSCSKFQRKERKKEERGKQGQQAAEFLDSCTTPIFGQSFVG